MTRNVPKSWSAVVDTVARERPILVKFLEAPV
jgi:hypothetical protein